MYGLIFKPSINDVEFDMKIDYSKVKSVYPDPKTINKIEPNLPVFVSMELV